MIDRAITFTQFLRPNGRQRSIEFIRPARIADAADYIIAASGRLEIEELMTGMVSMTVERDGEEEGAIAHEICANGPPVLEHIDKLLLEGAKRVTRQRKERSK